MGRRTHITRVLCFPGGEQISLGKCVSLVGDHISLGICVSWVGITPVTRDMCFLGRETYITRDMCFLGRGTQITRDTCFLGRDNTYQ